MPCTCDKTGVPWVGKDAAAVMIIILAVLKIGHGARLRQATLRRDKIQIYESMSSVSRVFLRKLE